MTELLRNGVLVLCGFAATSSLAAELTIEEFDRAVEELEVGATSEAEPLAMSALVVPAEVSVGETVIVAMKVRMEPTWYIYVDVPSTQPFIEAKWMLRHEPEDLEIVDGWAGPLATLHKTLPGTRVHASGPRDLVFFREMEVSEGAEAGESELTVGLYYQICNPRLCLEPKTKEQRLTVRIVERE